MTNKKINSQHVHSNSATCSKHDISSTIKYTHECFRKIGPTVLMWYPVILFITSLYKKHSLFKPFREVFNHAVSIHIHLIAQCNHCLQQDSNLYTYKVKCSYNYSRASNGMKRNEPWSCRFESPMFWFLSLFHTHNVCRNLLKHVEFALEVCLFVSRPTHLQQSTAPAHTQLTQHGGALCHNC